MSDLAYFYKNLTPEQVRNLKVFSQQMNNILCEEDMDAAQKHNTVNYVADLLAALRSGLAWDSLAPSERDFIKQHSHESHWREFESNLPQTPPPPKETQDDLHTQD